LVDRVLGDIGATMTAPLVVLGDKLGLFRALAEADSPISAIDLAQRTGLSERYLREWLAGVAAAGYVSVDAKADQFFLSDAQRLVFGDEQSPVCMLGGFELAVSTARAAQSIADAFRSGEGVAWHSHDAGVFSGTERFFRPAYTTHLVRAWIPALDGVEAKLLRGARAGDVGCGHGVSTLIMARAYPSSSFVGFDTHPSSIERARARATELGMGERCTFEIASGKTFPGPRYDLVTCFDCLHDMGDPAGAAAHIRKSLKDDGTWMICEPMAGDRLEQNLNPVGRLYYAASTMICVPTSLSQEVGTALGAQAGEARLREVILKGGFTSVRRAAETPFNMIMEARP
jgi:2-polyprenyl-3-methyl-5-hydroxy-6-metoxy-1,4-benzoquinol methylase